MLLLNKRPLDIFDALNDNKHPMHEFAKEYDEGVKELKERFGQYIKFTRPDYPKYTKGADVRGTEIPQVPLPVPAMRMPLRAYAPGKNGRNLWACCMDEPSILPNGLWDLGRTKSLQIGEDLMVDIDRDTDLAFFIYFKSPFHNPKGGERGSGQLKVYDPNALARELGEKEDLIAERKMAVWKLLKDEQLPTLARAYGINNVSGKQFPLLRQELEKQLATNDELRKHNPSVKGTMDFIEEMKITEGVLLRAFVRRMMDEKRLEYKQNGQFRIGDKVVIQVPANDLKRNFDFLCQYLVAGNNLDKLQEFMKDLLSPEYFDSITDKKEWQWLYKITGDNPAFKKIEIIQVAVRKFFCPTFN